jgi:hypothetical protein
LHFLGIAPKSILMKFPIRLLAPLCAACALFLTGCSPSDTHEKVLDDIAVQLDKLAKIPASVTDKSSAEKAAKDMKPIADELSKTAKRAQALGEPTADLKAKLDSKMRVVLGKFSQMTEAQAAAVKKWSPEVTEAFSAGSADVDKAFQEVAKAFKDADKK